MTPEEREKASKIIGELKKRVTCPCTVPDCPFKGTCCLCIRNHLINKTLPACCLPDVEERNMIDKFPECRTPLLWLMEFAENMDEYMKMLRDKKVKAKIYEAASKVP